MSYTVGELCNMRNGLAGMESVQAYVESLHINDIKFLNLLNDLLDAKITKETKLRKKRVIKFIERYKREDTYINNTTGLKEFLKHENINGIVKTLFSTKKELIDDNLVAFYIKDFHEYFNMFAPGTLLSDIIQTCK